MPITTKVVNSNPVPGEVYSIQHYVIKFVSELQQVFSGYSGFLHRHDVTEILLKVALSTINQTKPNYRRQLSLINEQVQMLNLPKLTSIKIKT